MNKIIAILLLLSTQALLAKTVFPLNSVPFIQLQFSGKPVSTPIDGIHTLDRAMRDAASKLGKISPDVSATVNAFLSNKLGSSPVRITPKIKGSVGLNPNFWGLVEPQLALSMVLGFNIFVSQEIASMPLLYRLTVAHEVLGHLPQLLAIYVNKGGAGSYEFLGTESPEVIEFMKITHLTASYIEWQVMQEIPMYLFIEEIKMSRFDSAKKARMTNRVRRQYTQSVKAFVSARASEEACPKDVACISNELVSAFLNHIGR